jgi:hypothetical protein
MDAGVTVVDSGSLTDSQGAQHQRRLITHVEGVWWFVVVAKKCVGLVTSRKGRLGEGYCF